MSSVLVAWQRNNIVNLEFYSPDWVSSDIWIFSEDKSLSSLRICEEVFLNSESVPLREAITL
jgi:hypothetical protein